MSAATMFDGSSRPAAGDLTVCAYCLAVLEFQANGDLRLLTEAELAKQPDDVQQALATARRMLTDMHKTLPESFRGHLGRA